MNILISGGAGFLGSHLCDLLIKQNHNLICIDNLDTGSYQNIKHLMDLPNFKFINHDICLPIDNIKVDEIYNLASCITTTLSKRPNLYC